ncbi:ATP synthase F1 subunit delta [Actinomyces faecalis]|uniref:ATP synthase F1 subunit delta n=1 Tax=Actinomyces faecalis TaxID=2722820 RepID=UPI0015560669|nr:ATP synthase F1 subunit delta [Actinomyces faecalis]
MNTGTAASRQAAREAWEPVLALAGAQGQELGEQILSVAHQVARHRLTGPLTDPGREPADKAALARRLFEGKVDDRVVELFQALVHGRWSRPADLVTALHDLGIAAVLAGARSGGTVGDVEQELFAVTEVITSNRELRQALEPSRRTTTDDRVRLAHSLFASRLSAPAMSLLTWCVRHRAQGGVPRNLRRVTELAAAIQSRVIADVVTAVPMTVAQEERLTAILRRRLGSDVELNTMVDPAVVGGVKITAGDIVFDSTVSSSIHDLRTALAS